MEINPNRSVSRSNRPTAKKAVSKPGSQPTQNPEADALRASGPAGLESELESIPEVREERVEEGRQLVRDPDYPNPDERRELGKLVIRSEQQESRRNPPSP